MFIFFFFNDTATTEIYTLSLHDALPISSFTCCCRGIRATTRRSPTKPRCWTRCVRSPSPPANTSCRRDRKSTRLNSSHLVISYAVFCLKKKKKEKEEKLSSHNQS